MPDITAAQRRAEYATIDTANPPADVAVAVQEALDELVLVLDEPQTESLRDTLTYMIMRDRMRRAHL